MDKPIKSVQYLEIERSIKDKETLLRRGVESLPDKGKKITDQIKLLQKSLQLLSTKEEEDDLHRHPIKLTDITNAEGKKVVHSTDKISEVTIQCRRPIPTGNIQLDLSNNVAAITETISSKPKENIYADQPESICTILMPHQRNAL